LRYFVIGVGSLFAYDLFLYAQAELLKGIDVDVWAARGIVVALAAPLLAVAVRRNSEWALDIFVSRQVVFYSAAFLAAGSYLLVMAIGGYYVRAMNGTWGGAAQAVFFAGAAFVLALMLFSTAMRRRLMVFISKHFFVTSMIIASSGCASFKHSRRKPMTTSDARHCAPSCKF